MYFKYIFFSGDFNWRLDISDWEYFVMEVIVVVVRKNVTIDRCVSWF